MNAALSRRRLAILLAATTLLATGCATVANPNPRDPFEPINRTVSQFNDGVDTMVLKPVATVYKQHVPPLVRTGVSNFFNNISDVWSAVNSLLQGRLQDAADNYARVQLNTFVGIFGIFDVASEFNIDRHREDFGQTLGRWGVPAGPYLVLPLLGPSTVRDTLALPVDREIDLVHRVHPRSTRYSLYTLRAVDRRANLLRVGNVLEEAALDKYSFVRDAYLQMRRAEIGDGSSDDGNIPDLEDDEPPADAAAPAPAR